MKGSAAYFPLLNRIKKQTGISGKVFLRLIIQVYQNRLHCL